MEEEVKQFAILEARDFFLKCRCDRRIMLDDREMYRRYMATPGITFDLEQVWKCEYMDNIIQKWDTLDDDKKGLRHYEFFIYMNRGYECFGRYVDFLLEQLDLAKDKDDRYAYGIIERYTTYHKSASGYALLCAYGDYADIIYRKIKDIITRLPDCERTNRDNEYNETIYKYMKSEEYISDCQKYGRKKVVIP